MVCILIGLSLIVFFFNILFFNIVDANNIKCQKSYETICEKEIDQ
jgi:hypothetical protein